MPKGWSNIKSRRRMSGFSVVEVLLAATVFGFLIVALVGAIIFGRTSTATAGSRVQATQLAEEGAEAVRNMRDAAFANVAAGTYGLAQSGGIWTFSGSSDVTGIFTRQVVVGAIDGVRRSVTVTVTWPQGSTTAQISVASRLTNWLASIALPPAWTSAIRAGGLDLASTNDGLKVATAGNYAYIARADGTPDFVIVDISNPATPTLVGSLSLAGAPTNIAVSGNYAYVTTSSTSSELQIINISNPAAPTVAGNFNAPGTASGTGVFISGTTAYMTRLSSTTSGTNEFLTVNVANPAAPALLGSYNNNINMREVWVSGNYAYVVTESDTTELLVINTTTLTAPVLGASLDLTGNSNALAIDGYSTTLLIAQGNALRAVSLPTPTTPSLAGSVTSTGTGIINDVDTENTNTYAFIATATTTAEFQVVAITNPASMTIADTVDLTGTTSTLNGIAYNISIDTVIGVGAADTGELNTFIKS